MRLSPGNWIAIAAIVVPLGATVVWKVVDHEIRITRRESNQFTAQQALELNNTVARLAEQLSAVREDLIASKNARLQLTREIGQLRESMIRSNIKLPAPGGH